MGPLERDPWAWCPWDTPAAAGGPGGSAALPGVNLALLGTWRLLVTKLERIGSAKGTQVTTERTVSIHGVLPGQAVP